MDQGFDQETFALPLQIVATGANPLLAADPYLFPAGPPRSDAPSALQTSEPRRIQMD